MLRHSLDQRALEVYHIIPRNNGGSDEISNLQALCFRCNAGKRDTDHTDFRGVLASHLIHLPGHLPRTMAIP